MSSRLRAEQRGGMWRRGAPWFVALTLASTVAGCAAGPAFPRPPARQAVRYSTTPLSTPTAATTAAQTAVAQIAHTVAQRIVEGAPVDALWWRAFGAPSLDTLIAQSLRASPTLLAAEATLRQAEQVYAAQSGSTRFPVVDGTATAQRQRFNPGTLGQVGEPREFTLLNASVSVRYKLDLAGGNRRALEALAARADYRRYQLSGARLTLAANVANTAIAQARLAAQVQGMEAMQQLEDEQLGLSRERLRLGAASPDEVLAATLRAEQSRSAVPSQRKLYEQNAHLLAVLAGREPGAGGMPAFALADFTLPSDLPLVVPSELVRRRPDVQAAEALLHAANAEYGVAVARLFPQLNLSASLGSQALSSGALFGAGSAVWALVSQLTQPLLNPGLPAEKRAALAAFEAAAANYQGVVLEALRNVADVLRALDNDAQTMAALASADAAAQGTLASVERQYALGAASWVQVLGARQQALQVRLSLDAARAQRLSDSVALFQAVGGGGDPLPSQGSPER